MMGPGFSAGKDAAQSAPSPDLKAESIFPSDAKLTVVTNRELVSYVKDGDEVEESVPNGGVATALYNLMKGMAEGGRADQVRSVSWSVPSEGHLSDQEIQKLASAGQIELPFQIRGVPLTEQEVSAYYAHVANGVLWPVLHGLGSYESKNGGYRIQAEELKPEDWARYREVNKRVADVITSDEVEDYTWVHDYHLMLVPGYVRENNPDARVGYFHHIPWPSPEELLEHVPVENATEIVESLLTADLVGFHIHRYANNFLDLVETLSNSPQSSLDATIDRERREVRFQDRVTTVGVFPIGIDVGRIREALDGPIATKATEEFHQKHGEHFTYFGLERLDYTKGLRERFQAVDILLEKHPELAGKFEMVTYAAPSRKDVEEYNHFSEGLHELVRSINAKHGTPDWKPIEFHEQALPHAKVLGYFRAADAGVVTPIIDGMNLVASEAIAAGTPIILGKGAGASEILKDAAIVDAENPEEIADAMYTLYQAGLRTKVAEEMQQAAWSAASISDEELEQNMNRLIQVVEDTSVDKWADRYLAALHGASIRSLGMQVDASQLHAPLNAVARRLSSKEKAELLVEEQILHHTNVCLMLDYDGTLTPIVNRPEDARISSRGALLLKLASEMPDDRISIVSGRSVPQLRSFLPQLEGQNVLLHGIHGAQMFDLRERKILKSPDDDVRQQVSAMLRDWNERIHDKSLPKGLRTENKQYGIAIHYRNCVEREEAGRKLEQLLSAYLEQSDANDRFQIKKGQYVLEIALKDDKGGAVRDNLGELARRDGIQYFPVFVGDDLTDEDAFRAVNEQGGVSIRVGKRDRPTEAKFQLDDVASVLHFVNYFVQRREIERRQQPQVEPNIG